MTATEAPEPPALQSADPLSSELRGLFTQLRHGGDIAPIASPEAAAAERVFTGRAGRRGQGTAVRFQLRIRLSDRQILEVRYRAYGCPYTLATCEWLACRLNGSVLAELSAPALLAAVGTATDWADRLAVPAARLGRLLVVEDALRSALAPPSEAQKQCAEAGSQAVPETAVAGPTGADNR